VVTGANIRTFGFNSSLVHSVAFSSNGFYLAAAGDVVGLWDLRSGIEIRQPGHSPSAAQSIAFSPGGKLIATGSLSSRSDVAPIRIWEVATGRTVHRMTGHASTVKCVTGDDIQHGNVSQR
jgi:WD40 repeat protein